MKHTLMILLAATPVVAIPALAQNAGDGSTTVTRATPTTRQPVDLTSVSWFEYPSILDRAIEGKVDKNGVVDYVALKGDANLDLFLRASAVADLARFPVLTIKPKVDATTGLLPRDAKDITNRDAELSFWINAYNASVLKTLSDAYPIDSPDAIKGFDTNKKYRIANQVWSLHDLRAKIVGMDPRAFFALTNGARGGPLLAPMAYRFLHLNQLLDVVATTFLNNKNNIELTRIQNKVVLSDVLQEANDLFASQSMGRRKLGGLRYLLSAYSDQRGDRSYFTTSDYQITMKKSDRHINGKS